VWDVFNSLQNGYYKDCQKQKTNTALPNTKYATEKVNMSMKVRVFPNSDAYGLKKPAIH